MRPNLPTLGGPPKRNPFGPVVAVSVILGAAAGGVWWWKQRMADVPMDVASQTVTALDAGTVAQAPV
ncbi:M23 family peptidase, partial [Corallococcus exercitus]